MPADLPGFLSDGGLRTTITRIARIKGTDYGECGSSVAQLILAVYVQDRWFGVMDGLAGFRAIRASNPCNPC